MADYNVKVLEVSRNGDTYTYDAGGAHYGECSTAAGTQTKEVTIDEIESLSAGLSVRIKFTNAQSYDGQPKLQINSLTATSIVRNGTTAAGQNEWQAGEVLDFVYDGTNFVIAEGATPTTTAYGSRVKLSSATNSNDETLAATPKAVKSAYDLADSKISATKTNIDTALGTTSNISKFYREDGTWQIPPGTKPVIVEVGPIAAPTGSSQIYNHTFTTLEISELSVIEAGMKPIQIECSNPDAFQDAVIIECGAGEISVECNTVIDDCETIIVTCMLATDATSANPAALTSDEYDNLNARLTALETVGSDVTMLIPTSAWSESNGQYVYEWEDVNHRVNNRCRVKVSFYNNGTGFTSIPYLEFEKIAIGNNYGVRIISPSLPSQALPVVVSIFNIRDDINAGVRGDNVATDVIQGAVNVDEALTSLNEQLALKLDKSKITTGTFTCSPTSGVVNVSANYGGTIPTVGYVVFTAYNFTTDRGALDFYFDEGGKLFCYSNKTLGIVSVRWMKYTP